VLFKKKLLSCFTFFYPLRIFWHFCSHSNQTTSCNNITLFLCAKSSAFIIVNCILCWQKNNNKLRTIWQRFSQNWCVINQHRWIDNARNYLTASADLSSHHSIVAQLISWWSLESVHALLSPLHDSRWFNNVVTWQQSNTEPTKHHFKAETPHSHEQP